MRFRTSGRVPRVDLTPAVALWPALLDEWRDLTFGEGGVAVDPTSGEARSELRLIDGDHRAPGARYEIRTDLPSEPESDGPPSPLVLHVRLITDDHRSMSARIEDPESPWWWAVVDVDTGRRGIPDVRIAGEVELAGALRAPGAGCLASVAGRRASAGAAIRLAGLERGDSTVVELSGRLGRSRLDATLDVSTSASAWTIEGRAHLRARGVWRLVMLVARARLRRTVDQRLAEMWSEADRWSHSLGTQVRELDAQTRAAGGPTPYVRRSLWG